MADALSRLSRLHLSPHHNATPLLRPSIRVPPRLNLSYDTFCSLSNSHLSRFPRFILCKIVEEHPDIVFLKVNFDENKPMCRRLNVRVLPYFHFYRGADGLLESFSCSLAKFQKLKAAIATHNTPRCSIGPPAGVGDLVLDSDSATPEENTAEASPR